ncbi:OmpA family protein [Granulosicoccaceae sp. 1_MG-2023]|nr:OmpA family protein [Granulosicoccaceae sp. 1_MG-2023]
MATYASERLIHKPLFWWLTGLAGLLLLIFLALYLRAGAIQTTLGESARSALLGAGLDTVEVSADGRDLILNGRAFDDTDEQRALDIAAAIPGVRRVHNRLSIGPGLVADTTQVEPAAATRSPALAFLRQEQRLIITGELAEDNRLDGLLNDLGDSLQISSDVSYSTDVAEAAWLPSLVPVLTTLPLISNARIDIAGPLLNIEGEVGSAQIRDTIAGRLAQIDPAELTVRNSLTVADSAPVPENTLAPLEEPTFSAFVNENGKLVLSGRLSHQVELDQLLASLPDTFGEDDVDNRLEISDRVSEADWLDDIMQILPGMKKLDQARVTVRDGSLNISGTAVSADVAHAQQDVTDGLDTSLEVKNEIVLLEQTSDSTRARLQKDLEAIAFDRILFGLNSADLQPGSRATLDALATVLKRYPTLPVVVAGHTDNTGKAEWNQYLSQLRAESVRDYLIAQGVNQERISAIGYGQTRPLVSNDTRQGRIQNRRIELNY